VSLTESYDRIATAAANAVYRPGVIMVLRSDRASDFAGVNESKPVTIRGRCKGTVNDPETRPSVAVVVRDCVLVADK
jgi:hypothetical protein